MSASPQPAATASPTLQGRVVLVTGGNRGIGLGLARGVVRAGADVVLWGRDGAANERAVGEIEEIGGRAFCVGCDVASEEQVTSAFARTLAETGRVDAVFANAGIAGPPVPFVDLTLDDWHGVLAVNLDGVVLTLRAAARHMIERGEGGSLAGVASIAALRGMRKFSHYAVSKAAVVSLMQSLAGELGPHGIRCNAILPGWIDTAQTEDATARLRERIVARTPARRFGVPDDFGAVAAFLADPAQTFHTGNALVVDGGYNLH